MIATISGSIGHGCALSSGRAYLLYPILGQLLPLGCHSNFSLVCHLAKGVGDGGIGISAPTANMTPQQAVACLERSCGGRDLGSVTPCSSPGQACCCLVGGGGRAVGEGLHGLFHGSCPYWTMPQHSPSGAAARVGAGFSPPTVTTWWGGQGWREGLLRQSPQRCWECPQRSVQAVFEPLTEQRTFVWFTHALTYSALCKAW